jgi:hypothetical protein
MAPTGRWVRGDEFLGRELVCGVSRSEFRNQFLVSALPSFRRVRQSSGRPSAGASGAGPSGASQVVSAAFWFIPSLMILNAFLLASVIWMDIDIQYPNVDFPSWDGCVADHENCVLPRRYNAIKDDHLVLLIPTYSNNSVSFDRSRPNDDVFHPRENGNRGLYFSIGLDSNER